MKVAMTDTVRDVLADGIGFMQAIGPDSVMHDTLHQAAETTADALNSGHKLMVAGTRAALRRERPSPFVPNGVLVFDGSRLEQVCG
jgi:hypothetical protein